MELCSKQEWDEVIALAKERAEEGDVKAMASLARFLRYGRMLNENNIDAALPYYKKATDHGDAESAEELGKIYIDSKSKHSNDKLAFRYFKQAADAGLAHSQYSTGMMYRFCNDVNRNINAAIYYLQKAAEQDYAIAQYELFVTLMQTRKPENGDVAILTNNLKITDNALQWLAKAYANGYEEAIECARTHGLDKQKIFIERVNAARKKQGVDSTDTNDRGMQRNPGKEIRQNTDFNRSPIKTGNRANGAHTIAIVILFALVCAGAVYILHVNKTNSTNHMEQDSSSESPRDVSQNEEIVVAEDDSETEQNSEYDENDSITGNNDENGTEASPQANPLPDDLPEYYYIIAGHSYALYDADYYGLNSYDEVEEFCRKQGASCIV